MESQQIGLAGEDQLCLAVQRDFEKLVVLGVAASMDGIDDRYKLGQASQQTQELLAVFETDVAVEFRARQDIGSSFIVASETSRMPTPTALRTACPGNEEGSRRRLTSAFVSTTMRSRVRINLAEDRSG